MVINRIKALVKEKKRCVLATSQNDRPRCSLMAYITDDACNTIYMVTRRQSHKYENLLANPYVSLLIDTRCEHESDEISEVQAVTVSGVFRPLEETEEKRSVLDRYMKRHPHLRDLADHPDAEIIAVEIHSFLLLEGALQAHYVENAPP